MASYILALDQGTTSSRVLLFDEEQNILAVNQREFSQIYPHEGWVEHDAMEIWSSQYGVMVELLAQTGISPKEIAAIGITNQRETTILWDKSTGRPIYNAIVWQCRRTAPLVDRLVADGMEEHIRQATGLLPDAYFSGTKIKWILDHVEGARDKAKRGEILFGTVDTWLLWKLTNGKVHATDYTNASRTMLYDIHKLDWDDELLKALDIPRAMLPEVRPSCGIFGYTELQGVQIRLRASQATSRRRCSARRVCPRRRKEYVWDRLLPVDEHGRNAVCEQKRPFDNDRRVAGQPRALRVGGLRLRRRRRHPVAAR